MTSKLVLGFAVAILTTFLMPASEALAVCCGANCCCIDGSTQEPGDTNPDNACQVCNPSETQMAWSDVPDCVADAGVAEDAGTSAEEDAGTATEEDAGTSTEEDAGTEEEDAGSSSGTDGGSTGDDSGSDDDGGCAAGGTGAFGGLFGLLLLGLRRKKGTRR